MYGTEVCPIVTSLSRVLTPARLFVRLSVGAKQKGNFVHSLSLSVRPPSPRRPALPPKETKKRKREISYRLSATEPRCPVLCPLPLPLSFPAPASLLPDTVSCHPSAIMNAAPRTLRSPSLLSLFQSTCYHPTHDRFI